MDWQQLEDEYVAAAEREILAIFRRNPRDTFYAVAIHDSYRVLDEQICLPYIALDSIEKLRERRGVGNSTYEYNPPDWNWSYVALKAKRLRTLAESLEKEANRSTQNHWRRTEKRFISTMIRVAKRLYADLIIRPRTTDDFFSIFDDEDGDLELIRKCLPKALFLKHFGELDAYASRKPPAGVASLPMAKRMRCYLDHHERWSAEIMKPGDQTIDGLIANLKDEEVGWVAAMFLGRLANSSGKAIKALRREVRRSSHAAMWSAMALGMLGDAKFLLKAADEKATRENAVNGIAAPLRAWSNESIKPIPLDYRPLERLLEKKTADCAAIAEEQLAPGMDYCRIAVTDIDEALRGLQSRYVVIRQHAVCILGYRSLGKQAAKKVLPALIQMLRDPHPNVRRLANLSISYWKADAKPYLSKSEE